MCMYKEGIMSEELKDVLSDEVVSDIVTQEGLQTITDLFEFFTEALDVAVEWILDLEPDMDEVEVRGTIADSVAGKNIQEIMGRLGALSEFQE